MSSLTSHAALAPAPALQPVPTAAPSFVSAPLSDAETTAAFRATIRLFGHWGVGDEQAAVLLDTPVRSYRRWKADDAPGRLGRDGRTRLGVLLGIHKALRLIFRDPQRGYAWVKRPNDAFGGASALDVMLRGELGDLVRVRHYLDAERGLG